MAWVTGAGRGIGRACALALATEGCHVALTSRTKPELETTMKDCRAKGVTALVAAADVTSASALEKSHKAITKTLGPPQVLVNAAGLARSEAFLKTTPDFMESMWRLNVLGSFFPAKLALPAMVEAGWGRIVNVASVAGKVGAPYIAAYASAKHGLVGLTRSLAAEFAAKGVTTNAVCPGYVDTKMTEENVDFMAQKTGRPRDEILATIRAKSPQNRLIQPDEVAAAVLHLCRDESQGVNGQALTIDGGAIQW